MGQRCTSLSSNSANRKHQITCHPWRTSPPLRPSLSFRYTQVFVFKSGTKPHINNVELGRFGRNRTNVWNYAGASSFGSPRDSELAMHPTVKPLSWVADAILDCSKRGGIVLDASA